MIPYADLLVLMLVGYALYLRHENEQPLCVRIFVASDKS